jgi:hypothetical protein
MRSGRCCASTVARTSLCTGRRRPGRTRLTARPASNAGLPSPPRLFNPRWNRAATSRTSSAPGPPSLDVPAGAAAARGAADPGPRVRVSVPVSHRACSCWYNDASTRKRAAGRAAGRMSTAPRDEPRDRPPNCWRQPDLPAWPEPPTALLRGPHSGTRWPVKLICHALRCRFTS